MDHISKRNPDLEQIREQGYAWVIRSTMTGDYGAPFASDDYYPSRPERLQKDDELMIVFFDEA